MIVGFTGVPSISISDMSTCVVFGAAGAGCFGDGGAVCASALDDKRTSRETQIVRIHTSENGTPNARAQVCTAGMGVHRMLDRSVFFHVLRVNGDGVLVVLG